MMQFLRAAFGFLLMVASALGAPGVVHAQGRHALVVGIDTYVNVPSLQKARNDARVVGAALGTAGFTVQLVQDAGQIAFLEAIAAFTAKISPGDEAVVYYAGHGVEIDGRNYLLPADVPAAAPGQEIVLTNRSIAVETLVGALQSRGARITLLILDACRDNPFPRSGTRSIGATRGLTRAPAAEGTFILYSAGEGETALDRLSDTDANPNSVFTRALVPLISEPGLPLREVSRRVRSDVRQLALTVNHPQFPAVYDQLDGDFSFTVASLDGASDPCDAARADWALIAQSENTAAITQFLAAYPGCPVLLALADGRLQALGAATAPDRPRAPDKTPQEAVSPALTTMEVSGAWMSGTTADTCELRSLAMPQPDVPPGGTPGFRAFAMLDGPGNVIAWDMVNPLPFDATKPISATVDGQPFALHLENLITVKPELFQGGPSMDGKIIKAMRRGNLLSIIGTHAATGNPLTITYDLRGFTGAFRRMAGLCNRTALLGWIE